MPRLSALAIRASLIYLLLGFTLGALLLLNKGLPFDPFLWQLLPLHIEFLLFGWTVQLILGMAFWILPRFSRGSPRGNSSVTWLAIILLNLGIWMVGLAPLTTLGLKDVLLLAGRVAEVCAVLAFALQAWPRVKASGA